MPNPYHLPKNDMLINHCARQTPGHQSLYAGIQKRNDRCPYLDRRRLRPFHCRGSDSRVFWQSQVQDSRFTRRFLPRASRFSSGVIIISSLQGFCDGTCSWRVTLGGGVDKCQLNVLETRSSAARRDTEMLGLSGRTGPPLASGIHPSPATTAASGSTGPSTECRVRHGRKRAQSSVERGSVPARFTHATQPTSHPFVSHPPKTLAHARATAR